MQVDEKKLHEFVERAVGDLAAGTAGVMVTLGHKLGLYKAMAGAGPLSAKEIAQRAGCAERYVREWANSQAAGGYLVYHPSSQTYELPPEQAMVLANDKVEDNLNPIGRLFYSASTTLCCAHSLSENEGMALGAQAGETRMADVFKKAGFATCKRATASPFHLILEARL